MIAYTARIQMRSIPAENGSENDADRRPVRVVGLDYDWLMSTSDVLD